MTVKEFGECVEYNIQHGLKHAILGLGAPGVGKSQLIQQIGKKYGYKVIDVRLAQMSEVEIGGLIYPNEERTKTVWLAPDILPNAERDGEKTILLLDEITSCTKRVQVAAYQLILDRKIGQYTLPEGTVVIALGNREDDDGVYIQLAAPLADRFEIHYLEPNFEDWKYDYALKAGVHPMVVDYLTFKPSALHTQTVSEDPMVFATPRSWVRVSDILKFDPDVDKAVVRHKIVGNIGQTEGSQFVEYCRRHRAVVTADSFLKGQAAPTEPDMVMVLISSLLNKVSFLQHMDDAATLSFEQVTALQSVIRGFFRLPQAEYVMVAMKDLLYMNRRVVKNVFLTMDDPAIRQFIQTNQYVLGLTANSVPEDKKWLSMWD